jgi:hypothetical protein
MFQQRHIRKAGSEGDHKSGAMTTMMKQMRMKHLIHLRIYIFFLASLLKHHSSDSVSIPHITSLKSFMGDDKKYHSRKKKDNDNG